MTSLPVFDTAKVSVPLGAVVVDRSHESAVEVTVIAPAVPLAGLALETHPARASTTRPAPTSVTGTVRDMDLLGSGLDAGALRRR